jgi:CDP-glycerol glycerophosphotransferase
MLPQKYKNVKCVKYLQFPYCFNALTSKYIITNQCIEPMFPIRQNQIVVNTWHGGGAYKSANLNNTSVFKKRLLSIKIMRIIREKMTNYIIAACEKFIQCFILGINLPEEKFLRIGMPRNDIFFQDKDIVDLKHKVFEYYTIDTSFKIVLYAPTYRGDYRSSERFYSPLNYDELLKTLKTKFGSDFVCLYRSHHSAYDFIGKASVRFVSDYPDMQELLCAADVLITDYSSSIWDFSFTFKPCFIYAPDLEKYLSGQELFIPIEKWPFPLAQSNEDLFRNILSFDSNTYINDIRKHHDDLGNYETGHACEQFCKIVFE